MSNSKSQKKLKRKRQRLHIIKNNKIYGNDSFYPISISLVKIELRSSIYDR